MKIDDLLSADAATGGSLDPILVTALTSYGFVSVTYSLYQRAGQPPVYVGLITGIKKDLSSHVWTGTGHTPDEAETNTIDALAKWILNQPVPYYPTAGATP